MQCPSFPDRVSFILSYGNVEQEYGLRLLLCVCVAVHRFKSRRTRHDIYHRARERHCEFLRSKVKYESAIEGLRVGFYDRFVKRSSKLRVGSWTRRSSRCLPIWARHGITWWQTRNFDGGWCIHFLFTSSRARRIGPEKGVIHIATAAVDNALWDLYARARQKPLWKLLVDMSPVRLGLRGFIT